MKTFMTVGILSLCAAAASAQTVGGGASVGRGPAINSSASLNSSGGLSGVTFRHLAPNPATQLHVTVTTGSSAEFVPSSFLPYVQAVEVGTFRRGYSPFVNYREALAEGIAELTAKPASVAQAALENGKEGKLKANDRFVQDQCGRMIRERVN